MSWSNFMTKRIVRAIALSSLVLLCIAACPQAEAASLQAERVGVRMLVVRTEAEAADLQSQLEAGEVFERLAGLHSLDPSAVSGGYLGTFALGDLRREYQDALEGLGPGEISPISGIDGGYFLFQLLTEEERSWMETRAAGSRAFQQGRLLEALELYEAAAEGAEVFGPGDYRLAESIKDLATVSHLGGLFAQAVPLYQRSMAMLWAESVPDALPDVAGMLEDLNDMLSFSFFKDETFDQAKSEYETAIREMPLSEDLYIAMANMLSLAELAEEAETVLLRAAEAFSASTMIRYELGELYALSGSHVDALERFQEANTADPNQAADSTFDRAERVLYSSRIGDMLDNLYRYDDALGAYQTAQELDPDSSSLHLSLAVVYLHSGRFEEALTELERARALDPGDPAIYAGLADLYLRTGRFAESVEAAEQALALDPTQHETHYIAARSLNRLGRREDGQSQMRLYQELQASAESDPVDVRELSRRAAGLVLDGEESRAIPLLENLIANDPATAIPRLNLGMAQRWLGLHQDAIDTFQTMADLGMGDSMVHRSLAIEHEALGNIEARDEHQAMFLQIMDATLIQLAN